MLGGADPFKDDDMNFRGGIPHGNNWIEPPFLRSHWGDQINQILAAAYSVCFTVAMIAPLCQKYANDGVELTPEDSEQRRRATHNSSVKGGKTCYARGTGIFDPRDARLVKAGVKNWGQYSRDTKSGIFDSSDERLVKAGV